MAKPEQHHRPVPDRARARSRCPRSAGRSRKKKVLRVVGAHRQQPEERHRRDPGRAPSPASPASPAAASPPSPSRRSTRPPRGGCTTPRTRPPPHERIEGLENFDKVIDIDQSPIGRTPRSNPATYTGAFQPIRDWFAGLPESKARGYGPGRFSFNVKGGRCEACQGDGLIKIEMHFLPDVYVTCDVCNGKRYNRETLEILFKGKTHLRRAGHDRRGGRRASSRPCRSMRDKMQTLKRVGLGYVKVGQSVDDPVGRRGAAGEAVSKELSRRATGKTLYILDEPTTGLHFEDTKKLLEVLHELVDQGNTVVVIEHNLDVVKTADWIVDFGPEGGDGGGEIVAQGTPEDVADNPQQLDRPLPPRTPGTPPPAQGRTEEEAGRGLARSNPSPLWGGWSALRADRVGETGDALHGRRLPRPRPAQRDDQGRGDPVVTAQAFALRRLSFSTTRRRSEDITSTSSASRDAWSSTSIGQATPTQIKPLTTPSETPSCGAKGSASCVRRRSPEVVWRSNCVATFRELQLPPCQPPGPPLRPDDGYVRTAKAAFVRTSRRGAGSAR